jgi:hypothetical protein
LTVCRLDAKSHPEPVIGQWYDDAMGEVVEED